VLADPDVDERLAAAAERLDDVGRDDDARGGLAIEPERGVEGDRHAA
jgi:hypothetical protein